MLLWAFVSSSVKVRGGCLEIFLAIGTHDSKTTFSERITQTGPGNSGKLGRARVQLWPTSPSHSHWLFSSPQVQSRCGQSLLMRGRLRPIYPQNPSRNLLKVGSTEKGKMHPCRRNFLWRLNFMSWLALMKRSGIKHPVKSTTINLDESHTPHSWYPPRGGWAPSSYLNKGGRRRDLLPFIHLTAREAALCFLSPLAPELSLALCYPSLGTATSVDSLQPHPWFLRPPSLDNKDGSLHFSNSRTAGAEPCNKSYGYELAVWGSWLLWERN